MLTISDEELPIYQIIGGKLRINHSYKEIEKSDMMSGNTKIQHQYITAICDITSDRSAKIEAIIHSVYTIPMEFSIINNRDIKPTEYTIYQEFRTIAKKLADGHEYS